MYHERMSTDYEGRCGNCHEMLKDEDKYCRYCGTKRGEGKFAPYSTVIQCIYGPMPVKRTRQCTQCKKTWKTCLMVDHEDFCPECGAPAKIIQPGGNKPKDFLGEWFAKEPTMIGGMEEITLDPTVKPD